MYNSMVELGYEWFFIMLSEIPDAPNPERSREE